MAAVSSFTERKLGIGMPSLRLLGLVVSLLCCTNSCKKQEPSSRTNQRESPHGLSGEKAKQVLAQIGDRTITAGDFAQRLAEQSPYLRSHYRSPERQRELLDNMVRFELLALEAEKRGYDRDPRIIRAERQAMIEEMLKDVIDSKLRLDSIKDEDVEAYYRAHATEYHKPAQVRISHILIADRAEAERVLHDVLAQQKDDTFFSRTAMQVSIDEASRQNGGDLNFISQPDHRLASERALPEPLVTAAFKIKAVGEIYPRLVQSPEGFHVLRLTAKREALERSLADVRRPIQNLLLKQRRHEMVQALLESLRAKAHIKENLDALKEIRINDETG